MQVGRCINVFNGELGLFCNERGLEIGYGASKRASRVNWVCFATGGDWRSGTGASKRTSRANWVCFVMIGGWRSGTGASKRTSRVNWVCFVMGGFWEIGHGRIEAHRYGELGLFCSGSGLGLDLDLWGLFLGSWGFFFSFLGRLRWLAARILVVESSSRVQYGSGGAESGVVGVGFRVVSGWEC
jgi:hypothetical protein